MEAKGSYFNSIDERLSSIHILSHNILLQMLSTIINMCFIELSLQEYIYQSCLIRMPSCYSHHTRAQINQNRSFIYRSFFFVYFDAG